jgi:hypothetical protein
MIKRHFSRAASAVASTVGRSSLLKPAGLPGYSAAISAAMDPIDILVLVAGFGVPTAVIVATMIGLSSIYQQLGEMREKVAASTRAIADAKTDAAMTIKSSQDAANAAIVANKEATAIAISATEAKLAANKEATAIAISATEAKLAANKEATAIAISATEAKLAANKEATAIAISATEAKLAANKEATAIAISANKEATASAIAATEAKLAAAEKVSAAIIASATTALELSRLKAQKSELK